MADNELDILIKFLVDKAAKDGTIAAIDSLQRQIEDFEKAIDEAKRSARELKSLSKEIAQSSREAFLIGTAITGGIFAAAATYVKNAKEATAVTIAWKAAQDSMARSGERVGAVLAEEALPLLERAAELAEKTAGFIEKHPEIVRAALNTGLVVASLGAVGLAVSKGIRIYADIAYLAAVIKEQQGFAMFDAAVNKFLGGVTGFSGKAGGGGLAAGASKIPLLPAAGLVAASAVQTFALSAGLAKLIESATGVKLPILTVIEKLDDFRKKMTQVGDVAQNTTADLSSVAASPQFESILKAYEDYKRDDLALVQKHTEERKAIEDDAREAEKKSRDTYFAELSRIGAQRTSALIAAARQLDEGNRKAEIQNAQERANIIRDGGKEIQRIEEDLQEQLRKSRLESDERIQVFTAARDALGLDREIKRAQQERAEQIRNANLEIRQRRADIAQRLDDLQRSYEQERAQRQLDYEARVTEIRARAAAEYTELRAKHQAELREIQKNRIDRIRALDETFAEERKRRVQQLLQTIRDLDASLLGEKNVRTKYYAAMTADLDKFLAAYRAKLGTLAASPGRAEGGYAAGLVRTGEKGYEYVLSHNTTQAAEKIIGGRLTQDGLIAALMNSGGRGSSVVWNDQRRFDGAYTNEIRRAVRRDTLEMLDEALS